MTEPKLFRYGKQLTTHDALKIVGVSFMILDHLGDFFFNDQMTLRVLGRLAAPLFFFLIGYTSRLRISKTLIFFGIVLSLLQSDLYRHVFVNILINFIFLQLFLSLLQAKAPRLFNNTVFFISFTLLCTVLSFFTYHFLEYGFLGWIIALGARLKALQGKKMSIKADFWLLTGLVVYFLFECSYFRFELSRPHLALFQALMLGLYLSFSFYRLAPVRCPAGIRVLFLILSRYSLEIYFYHLLLCFFYVIFLKYPQ